jgi:Zn-dependent peptidase ImmA (M78 family)
MTITKQRLERVFGVSAETADDSARRSNQVFFRSQDHLAPARQGATGRRLTAWEALQYFGFEKLEEAFDFGSAVIVSNPAEPAETLRKRRELLALERRDVARAAKVQEGEIEIAEDPKRTSSIHLLERIAQALALDESRISAQTEVPYDEPLAIRLRQISNTRPEFTPNVVLAFSEAAWAARRQSLLSEWLNGSWSFAKLGFEADSRYGDRTYPAWKFGYELARATRKLLEIEPGAPIESLRDVVETKLRIPLIHLSLPSPFAGATIAFGSQRAIALNTIGPNTNVWVRRSTIAHEMGHLLWDPDQKLECLRVDTYTDLEEQPQKAGLDPVEARANAFAIELLAPQDFAFEIFRSHTDKRIGLRTVMEHFGVSFISARYQIRNALQGTEELGSLRVEIVEPTDDWKGRESFTNDFFRRESVPLSRRGQFAWLVVQAIKRNLISINSGAAFLGCGEEELNANLGGIESIFTTP